MNDENMVKLTEPVITDVIAQATPINAEPCAAQVEPEAPVAILTPSERSERQREANKRWRLLHPEKAREANKRWRLLHPEKVSESIKRYYAKHGAAINARNMEARRRKSRPQKLGKYQHYASTMGTSVCVQCGLTFYMVDAVNRNYTVFEDQESCPVYRCLCEYCREENDNV